MKKIIIPIILLVLITGAIYYFQVYSKKTSTNDKSKNSSVQISKNPIVLGDDTSTQTNNQTEIITDGNQYLEIITTMRKPINSSFEDLASKMKYKTIFSNEDAKKTIAELKKMIADGLAKLESLNMADKFKDANDKQIQSLKYLQESAEALGNLLNTDDQEARQKYADLYSYKIDQSNATIKDLAVPK